MNSDELEEKMHNFIAGHTDILVVSSIIENGVDIPKANTLIVVGAENFGLASLYQLRGRVGRSERQAFSLFLTQDDPINPVAKRRMEALAEADQLGAGLTLAMRDLEIRGAGNILGHSQSGDIQGVGYELYTRMLKKTIQSMQLDPSAKEQPWEGDCTVELPVSALIPEAYIQNTALKMEFYQQLYQAGNEAELKRLTHEMIDRFGPPPQEVIQLIQIVKLRQIAQRVGLSRIYLKDGLINLVFHALTNGQKNSLLQKMPQWQLEKHQLHRKFKELGARWFGEIEAVLLELVNLPK
jgi:transcription-repair coupling factor (superfamily II helicase)